MNDSEILHIFTSDSISFTNIFDLKVVGSMDAEPSNIERLTIKIHICICMYLLAVLALQMNK
jgi:hypothetical protein